MKRPGLGYGMRHIALFVQDLQACENFYVELLGMNVEWRPDAQNLYLSSGSDNLALHQGDPDNKRIESNQRLDHIGFFVESPEDIDEWFDWLMLHNVEIRSKPRQHRDGARSFYCYDPDGTLVQMIHHPPISDWEKLKGVN